MPTFCAITFNENPSGVYCGGQVLSGKVSLTTNRIKAIRGIYITVRGYGDVRWTEHRTRNGANRRRVTDTVWYRAHDDYFNSRVDVLRSPDGNRFDLVPGKYEYNYQILLPSELPSSFNGQYGTVRYEVICTIDRPWKFDNVFKHPFTIIRPLDFNQATIYMQPVERQETKQFSRIFCCGHGGEIYIKGSIPVGGFVPGQTIPVSAFVKNLARVSCYETNACLVQTVEYRSYTPHRKSRFEVTPVTLNLFGPLEKYEEKELSCNLCIPAIAPTSLNSCNIIEVSYYVEIQLKTRGLHSNMTVKLPVTIGTIPYFYNYNAMDTSVPTTSRGAVTPDAPPAYEEAIKLGPVYSTNDEQDQYMQNVDFLPRYPVYNFANGTGIQPDNTAPAITTQPTETKEKY
ncbi:unnamed protein product [Hermetia illucens]|uniref:Arrestin C-terminal-like domain-containing protein n=1 Tax=Hermetia illucens TaxID=343691 RepID=A0A7R8Z129_HERIL|nr:arrestin domain-containing protein 2-like [Hermetia illucens]CAD7093279.1 unnamed protein product [Hermetia illucens]